LPSAQAGRRLPMSSSVAFEPIFPLAAPRGGSVGPGRKSRLFRGKNNYFGGGGGDGIEVLS